MQPTQMETLEILLIVLAGCAALAGLLVFGIHRHQRERRRSMKRGNALFHAWLHAPITQPKDLEG